MRQTVLHAYVKEILKEVIDNKAAAERLIDLGKKAIKNPRLGASALFGFMRTLGFEKHEIQQVKDVLDVGNPVELFAVIRDVSCDRLGIRPATSGSDQGDFCRPRLLAGQKAQEKMRQSMRPKVYTLRPRSNT